MTSAARRRKRLTTAEVVSLNYELLALCERTREALRRAYCHHMGNYCPGMPQSERKLLEDLEAILRDPRVTKL